MRPDDGMRTMLPPVGDGGAGTSFDDCVWEDGSVLLTKVGVDAAAGLKFAGLVEVADGLVTRLVTLGVRGKLLVRFSRRFGAPLGSWLGCGGDEPTFAGLAPRGVYH